MSASAGAAGVPAADFGALALKVAATLSRLRAASDVTVGCSQKRPVWSQGRTTLYRYLPLPPADGRGGADALGSAGALGGADERHGVAGQRRVAGRRGTVGRPLLVCFALVNRPYILDLQPDRSLVRRLLEAGLTVYLIDWGDPDEADRRLDLAAYVEEHLGGSVRHVLDAHGVPALDLLGVCQGGVLSLCYSALHPGQIANLVTLTTPVDFHTPDNLLSRWVRGVDTRLIEAGGNVPGELLNGLFLSLLPFRLMQHKYVQLLAGDPDQRAIEDFVRMEKWIFDSPPQAAVALAQFVRWFYQENRLVHGTLDIAGQRVDLEAIRQPVLNLYALEDHIVPPAASAALRRHVGSRDYSDCAIATGHIGMYVSRAARDEIPRRITSWLKERAAPRRR